MESQIDQQQIEEGNNMDVVVDRALASLSEAPPKEEEYEEEGDMTQEIMLGGGSNNRSEGLTLSQVNFDEWMANHAVLEGENGDMPMEEEGGEEYYEEYEEYEEEEQGPELFTTDIRQQWQQARQDWDSDENDDTPISISSSEDGEEEEEEYYSEEEDYSEEDGQPGSNTAVSRESLNALHQQMMGADAMLLLKSLAEQPQQTGALPSPPPSAYTRPPLPPSHTASILTNGRLSPGQAEKQLAAIHESIGRSMAMADEISNGCDDADAHCRQEIEEMEEEYLQEINQLNTQIFTLTTELTQTSAERDRLEKQVRDFELSNASQEQTMDELREKIRYVAVKARNLLTDLGLAKGKLEETKQALDRERGKCADLQGKCRGLEATVESLMRRLEKEQRSHEETREALRIARDGNANEMRRAELAEQVSRLESEHIVLVERLKNNERHDMLLSNSHRTLEARLADLMRKTNNHVYPVSDVNRYCEDRQRDAQLVAANNEIAVLRDRLEQAENELADQKREKHALLHGKQQQLVKNDAEVVQNNREQQQSAKKRRRSCQSDKDVETPNFKSPRVSSYVFVTPPSKSRTTKDMSITSPVEEMLRSTLARRKLTNVVTPRIHGVEKKYLRRHF